MIIEATSEHKARILELVNLLANFPLPDGLTIEDVISIDREEVEEYFRYEHAKDHQHSFVYLATDGKIAGFILGRLSKDGIPHIAALAVDPTYQRRGIAKKLISHMEATYKQLGYNQITLHVYDNNTVAKGLYNQLGFDSLFSRMRKPL